MKTVLDVCYDPKTEQCLDIHLPESDEFYAVVYFHGGGLKSGDKSAQKKFFNYMTAKGFAVISVNYRMYPNAEYPDYLIDAGKAVGWVYEHINEYGKVKGIYIGGSSAGGYISQMLCFDKRWLTDNGIEPMSVSGYIHDAGQPTCHFEVLTQRGIDKRRVIIDDSAPLYHVGEDEVYPPMLILVSNNDMKNRYEQTMLLVSTLKHFGHTENVELKVLNGKHCHYVNALDEDGNSSFGKLVEAFINKTEAKKEALFEQ